MIFSLQKDKIVKFASKEKAIEYIKKHGGVALDSDSNFMCFKHNLPKPKKTIFNFNLKKIK